MKNVIFQSLNRTISLSENKGNALGTFTPIHIGSTSQFVDELSQLMKTASNGNIDENPNSQDVNALKPLPAGKVDLNNPPLLNISKDIKALSSDDVDLSEIILAQNKQNKLVSEQNLYADNIGHEAYTEDEKTDMPEPILKIDATGNNQVYVSSENLIPTAFQFLPNLVTEHSSEQQKYKQLNTLAKNSLDPVLPENSIERTELGLKPLIDSNITQDENEKPKETNASEKPLQFLQNESKIRIAKISEKVVLSSNRINTEQYTKTEQRSFESVKPEVNPANHQSFRENELTNDSPIYLSAVTQEAIDTPIIKQSKLKQDNNLTQNPHTQVKFAPKQTQNEVSEAHKPDDYFAVKVSVVEDSDTSEIRQVERSEYKLSASQIKSEQNPASSQKTESDKLTNKSIPKISETASRENDIQGKTEREYPIEPAQSSQSQIKSNLNPVYIQTPQANRLNDDFKINDSIRLSGNSQEPTPLQVKREENSELPRSSYKTGTSDSEIDSRQSFYKSIDSITLNLSSASSEDINAVQSINITHKKDISTVQASSALKTPERKGDIGQTNRTQIVADAFTQDIKNSNALDQRFKSNQYKISEIQITKSDYKETKFVSELDEASSFETEQGKLTKFMENQNSGKDQQKQNDGYAPEKMIQRLSDPLIKSEQLLKLNISKNPESNSQIMGTEMNQEARQAVKENTPQETSQISYNFVDSAQRKTNIAHNFQNPVINGEKVNTASIKDDVMMDVSPDTILPKIKEHESKNIDRTPEKFDIPVSRVNNESVLMSHKTDIKNIPTTAKSEMTSTVVELPDKIAEYVNAVKSYNTKPHSVTIQLEPAHLGKIRLEVFLKDDRIMVEMSVSRLVTKEMIDAQLPDIRKSLMQSDVQVSGFNVTLDNGSSKFNSYNPNTSQQNKWISESWNNNRGDEQNNDNHENAKRYMRYVNNESMVDILT
jgi:flagellar hook-length control protein FliK